ncbi:MAG: hypothetical protein ACRDM1_11345 [Gaiellaceae bacterium]
MAPALLTALAPLALLAPLASNSLLQTVGHRRRPVGADPVRRSPRPTSNSLLQARSARSVLSRPALSRPDSARSALAVVRVSAATVWEASATRPLPHCRANLLRAARFVGPPCFCGSLASLGFPVRTSDDCGARRSV